MAYVKQNFKNGDVLTAEQLNHMEEGIVNAEESGGISAAAKTLILNLFEGAAYGNAEMQDKLTALKSEWGDTSGGGSSSGGTTTVAVSSVTVSPGTLSVAAGGAATLTATVSPSNATNKTVVWSVSPAGYATLSSTTGTSVIVTASAAGSCTITATAGGKSATCAVTVTAAEAENATPVYTLTAPKTFTAANQEYIDTGVKLFQTISPKPEWTIILSAQGSADMQAVRGTYCLAHCMTESGSYPGLSVSIWQNGLGLNVYGYQGVITNFPDIQSNQVTIALQIKGTQVRVSWADNLGSWNTISSYSSAVPQSLILGAFQETDGTKGRFWDGTLYRCEVYNSALSDTKLTELLNA